MGFVCGDPKQTCGECEVCSGQTPAGACTAEYTACQASKECVAIDECMHACPSGNSACFQGCVGMYPVATPTYFDYSACVYCGACSMSCATTFPCGG
jgi:hypothetical protein